MNPDQRRRRGRKDAPIMSMEYIRNYYQVPAKRGRRVEMHRMCNGEWTLHGTGCIVGADHNLHIRDDNRRNVRPYHPRYGIVYLDADGTPLLDTREPTP